MIFIFEIILSIIAGIIVGIFSGLTPGIHINMISLIALSLSPLIAASTGIGPIGVCVGIIAMGVTHTFLDAIPSIFLGAPNDATALGVLPGHRYLLRGDGLMAVKLFTIGSFFGLIAAIIMFPLLYLFTKYAYGFFEEWFAWILIAVSIFMIYRDQKRWWAIIVFSMSGIFGMIVFNLQINDPLFPMLSGLFGISTLIISLSDDNNIPQQQDMNRTKLDRKQTILSIIAGNISAFIVSTFPGLSSSIAAVMSMQAIRNLGDKGFMILMGCIGTSSFVLSLVALYTIDKARNGAVIVIAKLIEVDTYTLTIFIAAALIAGAVSVALSLYFGRIFCKMITKINYKALVIGIIILIIILVHIICSWTGLLVLLTSTSIGLIPGIVKIQRTQSMACLILPVIIYLV